MNNSDLRKFGIILGILIILFFGFIIPFLRNYSLPKWPFITSIIIIILSIFIPKTITPIYIFWMKLGHILGKINTTILLTIIFYIIITPMGFFMKVFGYDPLKIKFFNEKTYRKESQSLSINRMEVPY
ncbi:MAG: SxtJ family membrane protein [Clostridiales bacterium]